MLKQFSEDQLLGKPLSERQKLELLALMDRPDHNIDVSDIPEVRELPPGTKRRRVQPNHSGTKRLDLANPGRPTILRFGCASLWVVSGLAVRVKPFGARCHRGRPLGKVANSPLPTTS